MKMKLKLFGWMFVAIVTFTGCDIGPLPSRTEAFTNEFRVVNFVATNKVFIANEHGVHLQRTAESLVTLTNGQVVNGEVVIRGYAPGGVIERFIVYPKM